MNVSHGTCNMILYPAPSIELNKSNIKYSQYMDNIYVQYMRCYIWTNIDKLSNMSKYIRTSFFYKFIENPAPNCQILNRRK